MKLTTVIRGLLLSPSPFSPSAARRSLRSPNRRLGRVEPRLHIPPPLLLVAPFTDHSIVIRPRAGQFRAFLSETRREPHLSLPITNRHHEALVKYRSRRIIQTSLWKRPSPSP